MLIATFGGWGYSLVIAGAYFLFGRAAGAEVWLAAGTALNLILAAVFLALLDRRGEKTLNEL